MEKTTLSKTKSVLDHKKWVTNEKKCELLVWWHEQNDKVAIWLEED